MIPISEAKTEDDFILAAFWNLVSFDTERFNRWIFYQGGAIQKLAKLCPPTGIYRLVSDDKPCVISGYKKVGETDVAAVVMIFGMPITQCVDEKQIRNVTTEERGRLTEAMPGSLPV